MIANVIIRYTTFISEYNRPWEAPDYGLLHQHTFDRSKEAYLRLLLNLDDNGNTFPYDGPELLRLVHNEHLVRKIY